MFDVIPDMRLVIERRNSTVSHDEKRRLRKNRRN